MLEKAMLEQATQLKRIYVQVSTTRETLQKTYESAIRELRQAQADLNVV
jgi:uncharacterized protein YpmS